MTELRAHTLKTLRAYGNVETHPLFFRVQGVDEDFLKFHCDEASWFYSAKGRFIGRSTLVEEQLAAGTAEFKAPDGHQVVVVMPRGWFYASSRSVSTGGKVRLRRPR